MSLYTFLPLFCFSFCPFCSLGWQGPFRAVLTLQVNLLAENVSLFLLSPFRRGCAPSCTEFCGASPGFPWSVQVLRGAQAGEVPRGGGVGREAECLWEASPGQCLRPQRRALTCPVPPACLSRAWALLSDTACKILSSM